MRFSEWKMFALISLYKQKGFNKPLSGFIKSFLLYISRYISVPYLYV